MLKCVRSKSNYIVITAKSLNAASDTVNITISGHSLICNPESIKAGIEQDAPFMLNKFLYNRCAVKEVNGTCGVMCNVDSDTTAQPYAVMIIISSSVNTELCNIQFEPQMVEYQRTEIKNLDKFAQRFF